MNTCVQKIKEEIGYNNIVFFYRNVTSSYEKLSDETEMETIHVGMDIMTEEHQIHILQETERMLVKNFMPTFIKIS
jgi:hypothetical protein